MHTNIGALENVLMKYVNSILMWKIKQGGGALF